MRDHRSGARDRISTTQSPRRVAVVGGGIAGLTCARELRLRGCDPVVFEASGHLGGRRSSRSARVGLFDDGAQSISGATRLAVHVVQAPGELAALHPWTIAAAPAEEERNNKDWKKDEDETDATTPWRTECLFDDKVQLGVCGDSVVPSQVDRVHRRGVDMTRAVAEGLTYRSGHSVVSAVEQDLGQLLEAHL